MPERLVVCGGLPAPRNASANTLRLDVNAPPKSPNKVNLELADLAATLADNIPDVLTDMLEIAAYVYCADQFTSRGSDLMTNMGAEWRRRFRFKIPVRCPDVWGSADVHDALVETLSFLTEDEFAFEFVAQTAATGIQPYLGFSDPDAQAIVPDEVILLSGGLDSLAGAVDALIGSKRKVVLVSHQASTMIASKQKDLVAALRHRTDSGQLFHVPVTINKGQEEAVEFTQRSRSLLFATLGVIIARMFGKKTLSFYENGIVSFNLPITEHVLGARASRTTHPRVLVECGRLFSLLLSDTVQVENPFLWKTKSEVVRILADRGCADLITETLSCTRVREATRRKRHCGTCSQCVDRRFGILAADLGEYEPRDLYAVDLFLGEHTPGPDLAMVESYVLRAQRLATMSEQAFYATYGQVFRALPHLPGSQDDNARRIHDLHRRHGKQVVEVVDRELKNNASLVQALSLPDTSLLAMILSPIAKQPDYADPIESEEPASAQAAIDPPIPARPPLVFALEPDARTVLFRGGPRLTGGAYDQIGELFREFEEDIRAGIPKDEFRFVKADILAERLGIEEQTLRKRVSRARKSLEKQFLECSGVQLDDDDVIENDEWKGYRINPYLLLVNPSQLQADAVSSATSQVDEAPVTTLVPTP